MFELYPLGRGLRERARLRHDLVARFARSSVAFRISSLIAVLLLGLVAAPASAGPNESGMLVVHIDESIIYSRGVNNCSDDLRDCAQAVTSINANSERIVVLFLMASFPFSPVVAGVTFGIDYSATMVGHGMCMQDWFELPSEGWPESGTGTALTSGQNSPETDRLFSLYWFAVYAEYGGYFAAAEHPYQPTQFGDDSVPSVMDDVEGFGWAGFGIIGYNPCLEGVPVGACCLPVGSCIVTTESACQIQGGVYRGDDEACSDFTCVGPCCLDNECWEANQVECERDGGEWGERPGAPCGQISCLRENVSWGVLKHHHRY